MNFDARKLDLISIIISLNDESVLNKIEKVINENLNNPYALTKEELVNRALKSEDDYANGRVISLEKFEKISEKC